MYWTILNVCDVNTDTVHVIYNDYDYDYDDDNDKNDFYNDNCNDDDVIKLRKHKSIFLRTFLQWKENI